MTQQVVMDFIKTYFDNERILVTENFYFFVSLSKMLNTLILGFFIKLPIFNIIFKFLNHKFLNKILSIKISTITIYLILSTS